MSAGSEEQRRVKDHLRDRSILRQQSSLSTFTESTSGSDTPLVRDGTTERDHRANFLESMKRGIPGFSTKISDLINKLNCCVQDNGSEGSLELTDLDGREERLRDGNRAITEAHTIYQQGVARGRDRITREEYRRQNPINEFEENPAIVYSSNLMDTALSIGEWMSKYEQTGSDRDEKILDEYNHFFKQRMLSEFERISGRKHPMADNVLQDRLTPSINALDITPVNIESN